MMAELIAERLPATGLWSGGLAEWTEGETAYLSVAFTWRLDDAYSRACGYRQMGSSRQPVANGELFA
jgi:hypothetical protein